MNDDLNIVQFKYLSDGSVNNYPSGLKKEDLWKGKFLSDYNISSIVQFGIQTLPGVRFTLNGSEGNWITVGQTGIYEIELSDNVTISNIWFDSESIAMVDKNSNAYLILDLIYKSMQ